jgi:hypothetical protein
MNLRTSALIAACGGALLATSSIAPAQYGERSPKDAQKLARALAGRTPGKPVSCISNTRGSDMQIIDDQTILFREGGTVYVQSPRGGCHGLGNGSYTLVTQLHGSNRLCSGQIGELVDRVSGFGYGSCIFGEFLPYRKTS